MLSSDDHAAPPPDRHRAQPDLFLASSSPRRAELLGALGFTFSILPSEACAIDESPKSGEPSDMLVARLALAKAERALEWTRLPGDAVVLAGDTVVVHAGQVLGKPRDADDAVRMLTALSGTTHRVLTALAVANRSSRRVLTVGTAVTLMPLHRAVIADYVQTGEPLDKAGAYALQGRAAQFVSRIEGSWGAVVGLPQHEVAQLLSDFGILPRWRKEDLSIERSPHRHE